MLYHAHRKHKEFIFSFIFIFSTIATTLINITPTYAEDHRCDNNEYDIVINPTNIVYNNENIDRSTAIYNQKTLTLNGYNGGGICFDNTFSDMDVITVVLQNNNQITFDDSKALGSYAGLMKIQGDGTLTFEGHGGIESNTALVINGGTISLENGGITGPFLVVNNGEIISSQNAMISSTVFIINGGTISVPTLYGLIFNQNGGDITITNHQESEYDSHDGVQATYCFVTLKAVFNAGSLDTDCAPPAFLVKYKMSNFAIPDQLVGAGSAEYEGDIIKFPYIDAYASTFDLDVSYNFGIEFQDLDMFMPSNPNVFAVFRGGDIKMKSQTAAFLLEKRHQSEETASSDLQAITSGGLIRLGSDMIMEPDSVTPKSLIYSDSLISTFTDDGMDAEYSVDESNQEYHTHTSSNVTKNIHIYKSSSNSSQPSNTGSDSNSDSSQNSSLTVPNTIDSALFSIISTIVVSIIAEVFIIIDLRKRIYNTQDEIVNEDLKTINSYIDTISSKPEENNRNNIKEDKNASQNKN